MSGPLGLQLIRHDVVESTNDCAFAALARGQAQNGDVHIARGQSGGRGRLGRKWVCATDEGLYLSLVLLPTVSLPPAVLTVAAGLAALDAVTALGLQGARLAWPNDLFHGQAKLAGILVETRGLDPAAPHYVIGLGLNVRQTAFAPELEAERPVTSLARAGLETPVADAERAVLDGLARRLTEDSLASDAGRDALGEEYLDAIDLRDRTVRVTTGSGAISGRLVSLSLTAGLLIEGEGSAPERVGVEFVRTVTRGADE